jgi:hypothetical protein
MAEYVHEKQMQQHACSCWQEAAYKQCKLHSFRCDLQVCPKKQKFDNGGNRLAAL